MDALSSIFTWLSDHEAGISAVAAIIVIAGVVFAGVRSLLRRRAEASAEKAAGGSAEASGTTSSSPKKTTQRRVHCFDKQLNWTLTLPALLPASPGSTTTTS